MTAEELAARCERVEGEAGGGLHPDAVFAYSSGRTVDVEVTQFFGGTQRFRITVEEIEGCK